MCVRGGGGGCDGGAHTHARFSLLFLGCTRTESARIRASLYLSLSLPLFVPLVAFSSGSVSAAEDEAHGSERFGSERDEAKTRRGKSAWGESRPRVW